MLFFRGSGRQRGGCRIARLWRQDVGRKQDYDDDDPNDENGNNGQDDRPAGVFPPHFALYLSRCLLERRSLK